MTSSFLTNIGYEKPKSEQERFLEAIAPGGDYTMPPDKPKKSRGVQPSAGWKNAVAAQKEAVLLGRQLRPDGASAFFGPGGNPDGSGRGQAQRRSGTVGLMGPDGKPFDPTRKPTTSSTGRNEVRSSGTGTRTGPAPAKFDGTEGMDAFISKLQNEPYGINFAGRDRAPMESTNLPTREQAVAAGANMSGVKVTPDQIENYQQIANGGAYLGNELAGKLGPEYNTKKSGVTESLQTGIDAGKAADKGGSSKLSAALADKEGMRSYMDRAIKEGLAESDGTGPMAYANDGMDARSRAFLDYKGKGGSLMALRAAEAAQGTVYAGGKLYDVSGKNSDGKYSVVSDEGREYLRTNRNATTAGQEYKDKFMQRRDVPEDAKNPDQEMPAFSTKASYQQLAQRDLDGTVLMGEDDNARSFDQGVNRSIITGAPADVDMDNTNYFADPRSGEPMRRGFLPTEEEKEAYEGYFTR